VARGTERAGSPTLAVAPVLAGRAVAWGEASARRTLVQVGRRSFGAPATSADGTVASLAGLGASATRVAVGRAVHAREDPAIAAGTLDAGPLAGPLRSLVPAQFYFTGTDCTGGITGGVTSFAVAGPRIAWVEARCDGTTPAVKLQLQARPGAAPRTLATGALGELGPVALTGRYVAFRAGPTGSDAIVVTDLDTGQPLYTASLGDAAPGARVDALAVQADGNVAATLSRAAGRTVQPGLAWFGPPDGVAHQITLPASARPRGPNGAYGPPRLAADRVAVDVRDRSVVQRIVVATLDGRVLARVPSSRAAPLAAGSSGGPAADFDGARLAYATERLGHGRRPGELRVLMRRVAG
jgi:hypothetical protein